MSLNVLFVIGCYTHLFHCCVTVCLFPFFSFRCASWRYRRKNRFFSKQSFVLFLRMWDDFKDNLVPLCLALLRCFFFVSFGVISFLIGNQWKNKSFTWMIRIKRSCHMVEEWVVRPTFDHFVRWMFVGSFMNGNQEIVRYSIFLRLSWCPFLAFRGQKRLFFMIFDPYEAPWGQLGSCKSLCHRSFPRKTLKRLKSSI